MQLSEFTSRTNNIKARLYRMAFMYLGDEHTALDAVDEAIYRGLKALKKLRQAAYLETWLTRILINVCQKENARRRREQLQDKLPEAMAQEQLDALPLKEAIHSLPPELQAVIILRFFSGFTLAETAQSLGIPQGTVVTRQRRALSLLKLELSEEG